MACNFPFDRPFWIVNVSFPARCAPPKRPACASQLLRRAEALASHYGGSPYMMSRDSDMTQPGATFGVALAFEAGDANTATAINRIRAAFSGHGVDVSFDPDEITYPAED